MTMAAGYTLDLYCDQVACVAPYGADFQYTGQVFWKCKRDAIADGFIFHLNGSHTCFFCSRAGKKNKTVKEAGWKE